MNHKDVIVRLFACATLGLAVTPHTVLALECASIGMSPTLAPDDTGDAGATACGHGAVASGNSSTALGYEANSGGNISTALGRSASSTGFSSIALGVGTTSAGNYATAVGEGTDAGGASSAALGRNASTSGEYSLALGNQATVSGNSASALGRGATAGGTNSLSLGNYSSSNGIGGTALGLFAAAGGENGTALGYRASAPNANTVILGSVPFVNGALEGAKVGIGTTAPQAPLHVARNDGSAQILVQDTKNTQVARTLFRLASAGNNTKFEIENTSSGVMWAFTNAGTDFRISRQGSGGVEFSVDNAGNATLAGALTQNSDVNAKQDIIAVDAYSVLDKVIALPLSTWAYKDSPKSRHLGPMAQDFHAAFGLGATDKGISSIDTGGVALAAIQALNEKLESRNRSLEGEVDALRAELADMKAVLNQLLPRAAHN